MANDVLAVKIIYTYRIYAPDERGLFEQVFIDLNKDQVVEFFIYEAQ